MAVEAEWVAVDWGTTNLRAWGIGPGGDVLFARASDQGMSRLAPDAYPAVLSALLADQFAAAGARVDTLICGMAGARQGWMEAPYLDAPADLAQLCAGAVAPVIAWRRAGRPASCRASASVRRAAEDVMRGEETQLLGLGTLWPGFSGVVCMPGTHSKWVQLSGRRVERFATAMTGELFEVLRSHSVLRHSLNGPLQGPNRDAGFAGRPRRRPRVAPRAVRDPVQGARGVPAVGPHVGLVRGLSLRPADRRGDRRPARLDRQRRGGYCRHGRACCPLCPGVGVNRRQGAHRR